MSAPQKYPPEVRDRAIRLVDDPLADDQLQLSVTGVYRRVVEQLGLNDVASDILVASLLDVVETQPTA